MSSPLKQLHLWADAVLKKDIDALMSLYSKKATLHPTLSSSTRNTPESIHEYFVGGATFKDYGFLNNGINNIKFEEIHEQANTIAGEYHFKVIDDDKNELKNTKAKFTFCFDNDNLIIHHHSSLLYEK